MASKNYPKNTPKNDTANALNDSFDTSVNLSSCSVFASTPFKVPKARAKKGAKTKVYVRPVCDVCKVCGKEYRCHRSYLTHMRQHSIKDAASKYPSVEQITHHCSTTVFESVKWLISKPAAGESGVKYKELLQYIVANEDSIAALAEWNTCFSIIHEAITKDLGEQKILMPSVLLGTLVKNNEDILVDVELRKQLCELLEVCVVSNNNLLQYFVADFTSLLVTKIFKYYSSCIRNEVQENVVGQVELDTEDLETIHYISGSVVRGFYKKSILFPKNIVWRNISKLIVEKLLEGDSVPGPPEIVKGWTKARNKGKLFFVSGLLFDFFVGVSKILHEPTQNKLRIDSSLIIERVCQGCIVLLWDKAVGDGLNGKASYEFMCGMIRSFCTTFAVGRSKELLNKIRQNKAEASLALRARVAPRPKT